MRPAGNLVSSLPPHSCDKPCGRGNAVRAHVEEAINCASTEGEMKSATAFAKGLITEVMPDGHQQACSGQLTIHPDKDFLVDMELQPPALLGPPWQIPAPSCCLSLCSWELLREQIPCSSNQYFWPLRNS